MKIIRMDVSKGDLIGFRINRPGKEVQKYKLANNPNSIDTFLAGIIQNHKHVVIAAESISDYHRALALACIEKDNPL